MKPQELKIGNLVCYAGKVVKVKQVTKHKIGYHEKPNETRLDYARLCDIEPIPITEELLLNNGFKKRYDRILCCKIMELCHNEYVVEITFGLANKGFDYVVCHIDNAERCSVGCVDVKYLHQLQNAYYLVTGKELEIKL